MFEVVIQQKGKRILRALTCLLLIFCTGCNNAENPSAALPQRSMKLQYATGFSVNYYEDDHKLVTLRNGDRFLIVPEGKTPPDALDADIVPLCQPIDHIYLAATSAMSVFDALDAVGCVSLSGTKASGWYNDNARAAMERGELLFAGKYSEPDYELLLSEGCRLSVQSTQIEFSPETRDKLRELGIPVLIDHSNLETHPLGRLEWIRLYGVLLGKEEIADRLFREQCDAIDKLTESIHPQKSVVFFYITSSGEIIVRKPDDYLTRMIEIAGGSYPFSADLSGTTIDPESFYSMAKDADCLIYNSTVGGELATLDELLGKNALLADFKAVREGNVWCTRKSMFQQTMKTAQIIRELQLALDGGGGLEFLYRLEPADRTEVAGK